MFRSRLSPLNIGVALIGAVLLVFTVERDGGWGAVVAGVASIGWGFAAVLLLGFVRMACRARAWQVCADDARLRFTDAFGALLAGDAAGNLTPLGVLASEPTKILITRARIGAVTSTASVAIENAFYISSVGVVILAGTWLLLQRAEAPAGLEQLFELIIVLIAIAGVVGVWAVRARPAVLSRLAPFITRLAGRADAPADAIREVETRIYSVPQWPIGRILHVMWWQVVFHVAAVAEVWLILWLLTGSVALADAFMLETTGRFVAVAFKFVPYRLGIDEAASGAVATVLGFAPATGPTLALVRRLRIIVLNLVGVVRLAKQ